MKSKKLIALGVLSIISIGVALYNFSSDRISKNIESNNKQKVESQKIEKTQSENKTIAESNITPSYNKEAEKPIWIKNITFLSDKNKTANTILMLKTKLNEELKSLNKDIYEVELLENTYVEKEKGFYIEAKADKLNGKILIEYLNYEYIFTIVTS